MDSWTAWVFFNIGLVSEQLLLVSGATAPAGATAAAAPTAIPDYSKQWDEYLKQQTGLQP